MERETEREKKRKREGGGGSSGAEVTSWTADQQVGNKHLKKSHVWGCIP